jgi:uncharacterized protein
MRNEDKILIQARGIMGRIDIAALWHRVISHPAFLLLVGFIYIIMIAGFSQSLSNTFGKSLIGQYAGNIFIAAAVAAAYLIFVVFLEKRAPDELAIHGAVRKLMFGIAVGFIAMLLSVGIIAVFGGYRIAYFNPPIAMAHMGAIAISSGVWEEIFARGIIFRLCEKWLGSITALIISSFIFGAGHLANPNAGWFPAMAIAVEAGLLLGAIYMFTRTLWASIGLHMGWNFMQGGILGVNVSGFDDTGLIEPIIRGNKLLTGGGFGAEASLPALIICTAIGLYFLWRAQRAGRFIAPSWQRFKTGQESDLTSLQEGKN